MLSLFLSVQHRVWHCLPIGNHLFRFFRCGHKIAESAFLSQAMIFQSGWKIIQFSQNW